ncbi:MAG: methylmalonyl-CoA mutase, partial [Alphaproteobacteria bacterium]|nr:methylmalonyl-CoA mutase [Alphaproteobacteria bacterium]
YDEALGSPTSAAAQIAVATQHILRDEAHLDDVIDPLGGSWYVESLTNDMEARIEAVIKKIDDAGGMYRASESGVVQTMLGDSALDWQNKMESGEQISVGVNAHQLEDNPADRPPPQERLDKKRVEDYLKNFATWKQDRDQGAVQKAIDDLARACNSEDENVYDRVVNAAMANVTHGEICGTVRRELGDGEPLIVP